MSPRWQLKLDRASFLEQYWQRRPLLVRGAIEGFEPPVDANELAGLAMEEEVEARIIEQHNGRWQLQHGPFADSAYQRPAPWTLLVQSVDHYVPGVASLRKMIDFIPQWRVDDVMVSYAVDGGSAGPHYDNYDVFLLQGEGERLWQLGQTCDESSRLLPHDELRILDQFTVTQEFLLQCGDMLYVPPGLAHWGVAQGECTTFSLGFRAPRIIDMASRWADQLVESIEDDEFYRDPERDAMIRPGEISAKDIQRVREKMRQILASVEDERWFGELVTEPRSEPPPLAGDAKIYSGSGFSRVEVWAAARLAWQHEGSDTVQVYANGMSRAFAAAVVPTLEQLCGDGSLRIEKSENKTGSHETSALFEFLLETGVIHVQ
ncbi:MAG: cupin domain-containing protein [Halioglobus sp.]|nr:cupin domain-containing protein [Halioglobus sp.]